jgi:hypothetical protein
MATFGFSLICVAQPGLRANTDENEKRNGDELRQERARAHLSHGDHHGFEDSTICLHGSKPTVVCDPRSSLQRKRDPRPRSRYWFAVQLAGGTIESGTVSFRPSRYDGGGMRYLRFRAWLDCVAADAGGLAAIYFEEVRRHLGTDAAHLYGGFLATLTAWCEQNAIPYEAVPVGTIKRFITGKGNANKQAVIESVRSRGFNPGDDNQADAIATLLWAIETHGGVR